MKFLNSLLNGSPNLNARVYLQHELETAGLDVSSMEEVCLFTDTKFSKCRVRNIRTSSEYPLF